MRRHGKGSSSNLEPSQRQLRVGEQIRHIISDTLRRGHFNSTILLDKADTITVSEVRPSPDLRHARAYVMSLGGLNIDEILPALNEETHIFQKAIARAANLKFTPRVRFVVDDSFANAEHIENLLRGVHIPADEEESSDSEEE